METNSNFVKNFIFLFLVFDFFRMVLHYFEGLLFGAFLLRSGVFVKVSQFILKYSPKYTECYQVSYIPL